MPTRFRYTQWDGTQEITGPDPEQVLEQVSDDLLNFGDLQQALRNMLQRGMRMPGGDRTEGLRDLLQQLRQQRRDNLERFDLSSAFDDIQRQLDEIVDLERGALDDRLDQLPPRPQPAQDGEADPQGQQGPQQGGQPQAGSEQRDESGLTEEERERLTEAMRQLLERKQQQLDDLPENAAGQMKGLQPYEFENPEAAQKYQELVDQLRQSMMNQFFNQMQQTMQEMSSGDMSRMQEMVRDLNDMLERARMGEDPRFDEFMQKHGDMFGDDPPRSLEELLEQMQQQGAQMQNLLDSLPSEMRNQLGEMMQQMMDQAGLGQELARLAANVEALAPTRDMRNQYPFRGDEPLDMQAAMGLMDEMGRFDEVERMLEQAAYSGDLSNIDLDLVEEVLGPEARAQVELLIQGLQEMEEQGLLRRKNNSWELTPRGNRKIGQKALAEIFARLRKQQFGKHNLLETGRYGDRADDVKEYEFGDPFHLDLTGTIGNALQRGGPQSPVGLVPDDFQVYRSETMTQTATVVMLDLSWSMALRGSFLAAKKVAMALNDMIRMQYPRDSLYLVGFSAYAFELKPERLPYLRWDDNQLGTNMHQGLQIAQRLLSKHKIGTRQIIMITDGEPTAHLEQGRSYFAYPPSPITIRETLKEVQRCTRKDIVLNIFMLETSYYLKEFVGQVAKINQGRVFYTDPDRLGEYLLVDFVTHRRKSLTRA